MREPLKAIRSLKLLSRIAETLRWAIVNWTIVLSGLVLYSGLNAITLIIVARRVAPLEYGQYLASFALASFLVIIPGFGMDAWLLTQSSDNKASAASLWASSIRTRGSLLFVWIIAMIPLSILLPNGTYPPSILLPTILGVALDSLILLSFSALRIRGQHRIVTLLQAGSGTSLLALTLMLPLSDGQIALFAVARTILSIFFFLILLLFMGRDYLKNRAPLMGFGRILGASRTFMWAELASSVYVKADLTLISIVIGPLGSSTYGPAITILQAAFIILRALFYFFVPTLSKTYSKNLRDYVNKSILHFLIQITTGAVISIFLFLLAEPVINLIFTAAYADSAVILRLLSPIPFIRSINFALGAVLTSSNRQKRRTRVQISAALFNIIGNLLIIGPLGINGVAVVYVFSEIFLALGYILLVRDLRKQLNLAI